MSTAPTTAEAEQSTALVKPADTGAQAPPQKTNVMVPTTETAAGLAAMSGLNLDEMKMIQAAISDNINASELQFSRLAIMQPQSPEITGQQQGYVPGQIVDSVTREILSSFGKPPWMKGKVPEDQLKDCHYLPILPVFKLPTEFIEWMAKSEQVAGELPWKFKTLDQADPRVRAGCWKPIGNFTGDKPPVTQNLNLLILALDNAFQAISSFIVSTFSRTSMKAGRDITTHLNAHKLSGLPFWGRTYYLATNQEMKEVGGSKSFYYVFSVAKGPALSTVNPALSTGAGQMALWLADPTAGRSRQESMINSADTKIEGADADHAGDAGAAGQRLAQMTLIRLIDASQIFPLES